jgi:hypothetical protein
MTSSAGTTGAAALLANPASVAILFYCLSSITMTVTNKLFLRQASLNKLFLRATRAQEGGEMMRWPLRVVFRGPGAAAVQQHASRSRPRPLGASPRRAGGGRW